MDLEARVAALEQKLQEVEALANLALRLLAVERPVSALLERFGATESEELAVLALLDDLASRAEQGGIYAPSVGGFANDLARAFPAVRDNPEFVSLLIDTLKVDRPTYRKLHAYFARSG
ncbi:MAG TPA: hypothetical protein VFA59_22870 [Vicinamibacterales bacterium]|nr:hypothetical protein [Vicinamibacterales bacterium]